LITLKSYITVTGTSLLYTGTPELKQLESLALGPGDVWHSSLDYGFKDCFPELVYQTSVFWWFLNDFSGADQAVNWRIDPFNFVVREAVWKQLVGFDEHYENDVMAGLDFGFRLLRYHGGVPLYINGLFKVSQQEVLVSRNDRYRFYTKFFKKRHSWYMLWRQSLCNWPKEYAALKANKYTKPYSSHQALLRPLQPIQGKPTVSVVIPTMKRQAYTQLLLQDYNNQTYPVKEVVIVDATPEEERSPNYYRQKDFKFKITLKWQQTKGSCRARNEAIAMCTGDYIIFADDDVRILPDFVEQHIKLLQTYSVKAANGLDIMATNIHQDLSDLNQRLEAMGLARWKVGISHMFSNANSIVTKGLVHQLIGNDINFDGGYGEDADFGLRILKLGEVLLHNPYAPNLHLKPPQGGYRFWGESARLLGKQRKPQPWEMGVPVKWVRPVPSPTISYGIIKHFKKHQIKEWRKKYFFMYLFKGSKSGFLKRLLYLPYKRLQFSRSLFYAKRLIEKGERYE
jgi:glycosyltransferase involved in cell wall biosynthesis